MEGKLDKSKPEYTLVVLCADETTQKEGTSVKIESPDKCTECKRTSTPLVPLFGREDPDKLLFCDECWYLYHEANEMWDVLDHPQKWRIMVPGPLIDKITTVTYVGEGPTFKYDLKGFGKGGVQADIMVNEYCPIYGSHEYGIETKKQFKYALTKLKEGGLFISPRNKGIDNPIDLEIVRENNLVEQTDMQYNTNIAQQIFKIFKKVSKGPKKTQTKKTQTKKTQTKKTQTKKAQTKKAQTKKTQTKTAQTKKTQTKTAKAKKSAKSRRFKRK